MDCASTSNAQTAISLDSSSESSSDTQATSSIHSSSPDIDQTTSSSNSTYSPAISSNATNLSKNLSPENIMTNLKFNKNRWSIIDVSNKKSNCWKCFGIPTFKNDNGNIEIFDKFVSCKYCLITYSYSSSTRNMIKHAELCDGFNPKQTRFTTSTQNNSSPVFPLSTSPCSPSTNKKLEPHRQRMTSLLAEWVCSNIRPLSIVEDSGFKKLIEQAIHIGNFFM